MTRTWVQVCRASTVWLLLSGLIACSNLAESVGFDVSQIGELQKNRAIDSSVYLKGKVDERAPFLGTGAYQLQDDTGSIWVFTKQPVPPLGEQLLIKGTVRYQQIQLKELAGKDFGEVYVEEIEQLERTPSQGKTYRDQEKNAPATPNN